jgi:mono/diheme cytochrome c family protein
MPMHIAPLIAILAALHQRPVRVTTPPPAAGPTYSNEIVRIFQDHCQSCHHPGDVAPFSLTNYSEAKSHAAMIKVKVSTKEMPPWKPVAGCGNFTDAQSRTLTDGQIDLIRRWVDNGAPLGNPAEQPQPLDFGGGWALGTPDIVVRTPEFTPPEGADEYRCFTMPANTVGDRYVKAIDVRPGVREEVHHVISFLDTSGESAQLDADDPGPGYRCFGGPGFSNPGTLGGWAPGARPFELPDDVGFALPANARIVLQVHYHVHEGNPAPDQTELGVYLHKAKPAKLMTVVPLINMWFTIPPFTNAYKVPAEFPIATPFPTHLWMIAPHMHLLGRTMKVQATYPDGRSECLINIDNWDFNWQGVYRYAQPLAIPRGTMFSLEATYDNDTDQAVGWGEATTDEMCIAFLGFTVD